MNRTIVIIVTGFIILAISIVFFTQKNSSQSGLQENISGIKLDAKQKTSESTSSQTIMTATSKLSIELPALSEGGKIPSRFTCDGSNISPEIRISGVPASTQSLALIMEDPDVPLSVRADGMWNHWVVWNIPPTTTVLTEGAVPPGVLGKGTNGRASYLGPCPPDREHRYFFKLFALDSNIDLLQGSTKEELLRAMNTHIIEQTELIGLYERIK